MFSWISFLVLVSVVYGIHGWGRVLSSFFPSQIDISCITKSRHKMAHILVHHIYRLYTTCKLSVSMQKQSNLFFRVNNQCNTGCVCMYVYTCRIRHTGEYQWKYGWYGVFFSSIEPNDTNMMMKIKLTTACFAERGHALHFCECVSKTNRVVPVLHCAIPNNLHELWYVTRNNDKRTRNR